VLESGGSVTRDASGAVVGGFKDTSGFHGTFLIVGISI